MIDGAKPQPPQTMKPAVFLEWVQKQKPQARQIISCYKAGPTGFWLHRQLTALGVRNYVVCPVCLDERRQGEPSRFSRRRHVVGVGFVA
jgi:hypothetical protein